MKSYVAVRFTKRACVIGISLRGRVDKLAEARETAHAVLKLLYEIYQVLYRRKKYIHKDYECREVGDGYHALVGEDSAENKDDNIEKIYDEIISREKNSAIALYDFFSSPRRNSRRFRGIFRARRVRR